MATPNSPHVWVVVEDCIEAVLEKAQEHQIGVADLKLDIIGDVVDFSGPRRLTRGILKSLSSTVKTNIGNDNISHVAEPLLIDDVLVMPDYALANSMNQQYGDKGPGQILVMHHYAGSWKNPFGGETAREAPNLQ